LEVASVLRGQARAGVLDSRRANLALDDLAATPIERAPHLPLLRRCWQLREDLSVYEAAYVALAEALQVQLLTGDRRLAVAPVPDVRSKCSGQRPDTPRSARSCRCGRFTWSVTGGYAAGAAVWRDFGRITGGARSGRSIAA
jgi:hypothetical protein